MANTIQHKRGAAADWTTADPILGAGEFGFETDTGKLKLGDGSTAWTALGYFEPAAAVVITQAQGTNYGYSSGGLSPANSNVIDKFSFATDGSATNVGALTITRYGSAGQSSSTSGYTSGGASPTISNVIDKFSFATDGNATDVGDLISQNYYLTGQSSIDYGYASGGNNPALSPPRMQNTIQKFPFAADGNATSTGILTVRKQQPAGQSSAEYGYSSGGKDYVSSNIYHNIIDKFSFATDGNATDVGDLTTAQRDAGTGTSSSSYGYSAGGVEGTSNNTIDKFSFATDGNATDVGDLSVPKWGGSAGQSSGQSGYVSGGYDASTDRQSGIDKFPFATDANATEVGNLTVARSSSAGQQY